MLSKMKELVFDVGGLPNSRRIPSEKPGFISISFKRVSGTHTHTHTRYLTHILLLLLLLSYLLNYHIIFIYLKASRS